MTDTTENSTQAAEAARQEQAAEQTARGAGGEGEGEQALGDGGRKALQAEREAARKARAEADRFREEAERTAARLAELEAAELRREVAAEKGLTSDQAELLAGETPDEMAAHADRLLAAFRPEETGTLRRRPQERLRPGAVPDVEGRDYSDVADDVMRGW